MDISFIMVNFQSADRLRRSLESLQGAFLGKGLFVEYIIVNNDPVEGAAVNALPETFLHLSVIQTEANIGFGQASVLGSKQARGKVLFFLNPDTVFQGGNFLGLLEAFRYRPKAIYGMALTNAFGQAEAWSAGLFPSLFQLLATNTLAFQQGSPWKADIIRETDWVSGAALAIRRDFFEMLSGFDARFFLYFEDVDLAKRAKESGGQIMVYPFLRFFHEGGHSHPTKQGQKQYFYQSQLRFFIKWRPWYESAILLLLQKLLRYRS